MSEPTIYIAIAYRWGCYNEHWYIVNAGLSEEAITSEAEEERDSRGGKYGVAVISMTDDRRIAYFPSSRGEDRPRTNPRVKAFERIGIAVASVCEDGKVLVPDPDRPDFMKFETHEVPTWLRDEYKRIMEFEIKVAEIMEGAEDKEAATLLESEREE